MKTFLTVLFFLDCFVLIGLVLWHMSEHAELGGAFGAGMSATVFGRDVSRDPRKLAIGIAGALFLVLGLIIALI